MRTIRRNGVAVAGLSIALAAGPARALDIVINAGATLQSNTAALAAFNNAAAVWENHFSDPITITIDADLGTFSNNNIIGGTTPYLLQGSYTEIRDQLVADSPANSIAASLPTAGDFSIRFPRSRSYDGSIVLTKANAKALGFDGIDETFPEADAQITFNQNFSFDYNRADGIDSDKMDFEFTAMHEIGHALGFLSIVDPIDQISNQNSLPATLPIELLDLFRFRASQVPTAATFGTAQRDAEPGVAAVLSDGTITYDLSTGVLHGDGNQASHWKDDDIAGTYVGGMDPTLDFGRMQFLTDADFWALDLIGYDLSPTPEPGTAGVGLLAVVFLVRRRRATA